MKTNAKGERLIWPEARWVEKLSAMRSPGERYSEVILRLAAVRHESLSGS